jgi:hypothetical protein
LRRLKANVKPVRYLAMPDGSELDESLMKRLLELLASFPNRSLAIAALQKAVRLLQQGQEVSLTCSPYNACSFCQLNSM